MSHQDSARWCARDIGCSSLDDEALVGLAHEDGTRHDDNKVSVETPNKPSIRCTPPSKKPCPAGMSSVEHRLCDRYSTRVASIIMKSWRPSTQKQYNVYIHKWIAYCSRRHLVTPVVSVAHILDFLAELHSSGCRYSALNTARSALAAYLAPEAEHKIGQHDLIKRSCRECSKHRPSFHDTHVFGKFKTSLRF